MLKRVSNINPAKFRSIALQKQNYFKIQNKEMMRDVVTDFIIHSVSSTNQSLSRKYRPRKYKPLQVKIQIKGTNHLFQFSLPSILQNYVSFEKSTSNREEGLQSLIIDILDFIDKLEDASQTLTIEVEGTLSSDIVLKAMINNHIREKNRKILLGEFEEVKHKIYTKYKKVSFLEFGDGKVNRYERDFFIQKNTSEANSELRSRSTLSMLDSQQFNSNKISVPTKSKLKTLVENYNIFQHTDKVEELRIQKLKTQFCTNDKEIHQAREFIAKQSSTRPSSNTESTKILEDWINQISLSEYLFKKKYQTQKQNKHTPKKHSNTNSGITSSDDQP